MSNETLTWRCDQCGEPACFVEPGDEPVRELFLTRKGKPARCWCLRHWTKAFVQTREVTTA